MKGHTRSVRRQLKTLLRNFVRGEENNKANVTQKTALLLKQPLESIKKPQKIILVPAKCVLS